MKNLLLAAIALPLFASAAIAAPVVIRSHDHLALSPAGDRMVDIEADDPGNLADDPHGHIVLRDTHGAVLSTFDPCGSCRYADTAWSPRGDAFAFLSFDRKAGNTTLYTVTDGKLTTAATISGIANTLRYAPDGSRIALLATVGAHKLTGAVEAGAALTGEIGESNDEQRIALVPAQGGAITLVSPADTYIYEYDWTPDGNGLVVTSAKGNGDNNWWVATLDHVDASTGAMRRIAAPKTQIEVPRVSPDGKTVAFIGGLMSDWGSIGGDLYTVPLAGGEPVDISPDFKGSLHGIEWRGNRIFTGSLVDDHFAIAAVDPNSHAMQSLWSGPVSVRLELSNGLQITTDGMGAALAQGDFNHASEISFGKFADLKPITHDNAKLAENVSVQSVHWTNEGFHLQGWLIGPKKPSRGKHPMIVIVHGGPSAATTPRYVEGGGLHGGGFDFDYDVIQKGYYIFYPNDRGSYGQGEAFTRANVKDFGRGDMRDMLAGVDAVEKIAPVDDNRLGLYGHSYGGWFAMWANTQTKRFKAFVAGAGIANWTSYYGQNGIDQWMIPFFGASVYDDPAVYRAASPIEFIKNATTPTLIYVGERDVECPAPQSLEYWHALKTMGTPTQLFIYAGEGHRFRKLSNINDLRGRIIDWFGHYLD